MGCYCRNSVRVQAAAEKKPLSALSLPEFLRRLTEERSAADRWATDENSVLPTWPPARSAGFLCCTPDRRSSFQFGQSSHRVPRKQPKSRQYTPWSCRNWDERSASASGIEERAWDSQASDSTPAHECRVQESRLTPRHKVREYCR